MDLMGTDPEAAMADAVGAAHWDKVFASRGEAEVSWYEAEPTTSLEMVGRSGVDRSAPIIDVGGGIARLVDRLREEGYSDLTVLDISAEAIRRLLERQPEGAPVEGIVADITAWRPPRRYALWHDRAVLHFLTEESDRAGYRRTLMEALAPGGTAIIMTFAPEGPERCSGLPVRRYGRHDLEAFLGDAFALEESLAFDHPTPGGAHQRFHAARLRRLASDDDE